MCIRSVAPKTSLPFVRVNSAGYFRFLGSWEVRNQAEVHRCSVESRGRVARTGEEERTKRFMESCKLRVYPPVEWISIQTLTSPLTPGSCRVLVAPVPLPSSITGTRIRLSGPRFCCILTHSLIMLFDSWNFLHDYQETPGGLFVWPHRPARIRSFTVF